MVGRFRRAGARALRRKLGARLRGRLGLGVTRDVGERAQVVQAPAGDRCEKRRFESGKRGGILLAEIAAPGASWEVVGKKDSLKQGEGGW